MKYTITADPKQIERDLPITQKGMFCLDFSYYTLCKIAGKIMFSHPTAETMAIYAKMNGPQVLTLDDLGNYVSLEPMPTGALVSVSNMESPMKTTQTSQSDSQN